MTTMAAHRSVVESDALGLVAAPSLPAAGPAWFGAVMGTGILATLSQTVRPAEVSGLADLLARTMLVLAWLALAGLCIAGVARRGAVRAELPQWGMVSMGLLAVGAATAAVVPAWAPSLASAAWTADALLWTLGTGLGLVTALGFAALLVRRDLGAPTTVWGLALVPPMVSATVGAGLVGRVSNAGHQLELTVVLLGCFFLGLFVAGVVFAVCYVHHWRATPLPVAAAASAWIPLGVVGQSTAAAQSIALHGGKLVAPGVLGAVHSLAVAFGSVMLLIGVPLVAWAATKTVRGFAARMPFAPGWWALTFPVGTLSLGSYLLGRTTGLAGLVDTGRVCWLVLCGAWALCAVATLRAVVTSRPSVGRDAGRGRS